QVHSDYQSGPLSGYTLEAMVDGHWELLTTIEDNVLNPRHTILPEQISASALRLKSTSGRVGVNEIKVYSEPVGTEIGVLPISADAGVIHFPDRSHRVDATLLNLSTERISGWVGVSAPTGWHA